MAKLDSFHHDLSALFASFMTLALMLGIGAIVSGALSAQARALSSSDVTWTQSLHEEVKVAVERFTGGHGDHPDLIASHCGRSSVDLGVSASNCPRH